MSETIEPTTETGTALAVIRTALPTILAADQNDILGKLADKVKSFRGDISTAKGRDAIRSLAAEIASSKMTLIKLGKSLTTEWRDKTKAVNAECNVIEERMDALKEQVRRPLTDFENAEKARVAGHEAALIEIERWATFPGEWTAEQIADHYAACVAHPYQERDWQEFAQRAQDFIHGSINALDRLYARKVIEETEAAELARLRAEQAERDRLAAIEAQRQREEQIARDAAEAARVAAEAEADRKAQEAQRRAQEERDAAAERERQAAEALAAARRQAEQEREVAQQVAARAEAARVKGHQDALETMRRLAEPLTPPDAVAVIDAKRDRLEDVYDREWEEFGTEAKELLEAGKATLAAARVVSVRVAEEAEAKRQAAEIERQERQAAAAVEAERQRVEEAKRAADAEAARRAENVTHRRRINGDVLADILKTMSEVDPGNQEHAEAIAKAIIAALDKSQIRHVSISY